jgi:hypothetical protein
VGRSRKKKKLVGELRPPALEGPCAGWAQDGCLFFWSLPHAEVTSSATTDPHPKIWQVDLSSGVWSFFSLDRGPGSEEGLGWLSGGSCNVWLESSACFDVQSRKAHVFGGWSGDGCSFGMQEDGARLTRLQGTYFANLVQIDTAAKTIRAMGPVGGGKGILGPCERGHVMITACSSSAGNAKDGVSWLCGRFVFFRVCGSRVLDNWS